MTTHRIDLTPVSLTSTGYRYEVRDRETNRVLIERTRVPICDAARFLHAHGADDADRLETYRPGSPVCHLVGTIGGFRRLTVREDETIGPRFVQFRPRPTADT